ncbi:GBS Bsp-like repeat-containing protein [Streptococcus sp. SC1]|uniref:GBS Bsp-like repeat-containing protein n=1 Tax=Streptococcus sp. SC1 TaxID=3018031 RepID=UPI00255A0BBE|nr:GBS Bsp-like repeat-containing protein [Streptococcus sp. SC1]MDL2432730.1 GBS Bsp-like repeat-containing protein [Streptococcus sp. SC1]
MKSKELIYLASTAILLAATANVVQAEENAPTTTDPEVAKAELQVEKDHQPQQVALPEAVSTDRQVKQESSAAKFEASPVYKAPENLAPAASLVKENVPENKASEQAKIATSEAIQNPVKAEQTSPAISASPASKKGSTSFYNAASSSGQTARGNSQAEIKGSTFVDVSSHNGHISVEDYRQLASKGVGGVVVKLTEGTHYTNPYAESQVRNAQAAGLQVSTYAFSHYTNDAEARAEARYYAAFANKLSLPKNTVMVNDMEDPKMQSGINQHTQAWADEMRKQGYANLMYYTSASWVDQNNLRHKGSINTSLFGLDNFWIAQYPAPKLSANDAKNLKYNSRAGAWQFTSQAQLLSGKHVFDQSIDYSGRFTARATLVKQPLTGKISIQNNNPKTGTFDVVVSEVSAPHGVQEVKLPTWSSERGQDDIVWYTATKQANGTYKLTVNAANHKGSTGEYNVHLYYVQGDGKLVGVGGTTTKVSVAKPEGKLTIANNDPKAGTFDVIVSEVSSPQGVREVLLPTWSNDQGQDDIIWHKAQKQSDGTYKFTVRSSEHKNSIGDYSVHLYYVQGDGKLVGVGGTTTKVSVAKPEGKLTIANNDPKTGTFDVIVSEVSSPQGVREVLLPTWSNENGQDDIIWHKAQKQSDGTYKFTVRSSEHKNSVGDYSVHLYYIQNDGKLVGVGGTTTKVSVAKPEGKLTIANNNPKTGTFDVIVSEVSSPQGVREVLLPTWSHEQGQDDIIWHKAQRQSDGTYKFTVRASEHKNSVGDYSVHLYYVQGDGKLVGVGGTTTKVSVAKPEGKLTIANNDPKTGTFDVIVSEVSSPQGIREVLLPTWSNDQGQDDIIWHKAQKQSDGTYKFTVSASEHKNSVGDYSVHLYYIQDDGKMVGVGGTTTKVTRASVAKPEGKLTIANNNPKTGTFDVIVSEVSSPQGVREVLLPTWSNDQGQDDIIWHKAQKQSDGTYKFTVRSSEHKNSVGDYSVHLYYVQSDGKMVGVGGTTTKVSLASVAKPEGKLTIANNNPKTGTFDVIVSEVSSPQGVREVLLPTWSNENGQDDIIWHKAQKQSDGTYKFTVRSSEHKNSVGDYSVHLYYIQNDGKMVGVGGTTTKVSIATGEKPQGKISIQNKNNETGEFDIVVSGVVAPEGVKTVYLPTWSSQNGQDDIQWYTAERQADGTYRKHVYARDHKNSQGEYNVHLYYLNNRNQLQGAGGEKTTISIKHPQSPSSQRDRVLAAAAAMVGVKGGSAEHHRLVNDYNSVRPLPVGYAVKNSDDWCDIFTTVIFQREGLSDLIGRECGVERHIHIFKRLGIWNEDGNSTPKAGDIITFNWDQNSQQNDGWADHIGIVEKVENGIIHTIEGNSNNVVKRNTYRIGHGNIRGFATPRYR